MGARGGYVAATEHQPNEAKTSITVTCLPEMYDDVYEAVGEALADFENR